jgi:SAM-dependent methyltransferase
VNLLIRCSRTFSLYNRKRKLDFIQKYITANSIKSCLIVGAIPKGSNDAYQNLIEIGVLRILEDVVISGIESDGGEWPNWHQADGTNLPFSDKSFDLVLSNAVIEHVGDFERQHKFIEEHLRVGRFFILTTPNRLFPIESHTQVIFKHMKKTWTHPSFTRLLSKADLKELLPPSALIKGNNLSPTFIAFSKHPSFKKSSLG